MKTTAIFGPPGTGKTTALKNMIESYTQGDQKIAVLSFSKAAANNIGSVLKSSPNTYVGTIHALCFAAMHLTKKDILTPDRYAMVSGMDEDLVVQILRIRDYAINTITPIESILGGVELQETSFLAPDVILSTIQDYEHYKRSEGYLDFTDLLLEGKNRIDPYDLVFIDEAQDLSNVQWEVVDAITSKKLIFAGDDDQSIYTFIGSNPLGMLRYRGTNTLILDQSYRIPRKIFSLAERTVLQIGTRKHKKYKPRPAKGSIEWWDTYENLFLDKLYNKSHIVLFRDKWAMENVKEFFHACRIPYIIKGGYSPLQSRTAKAIRAIRYNNQDWIEENPDYFESGRIPKYGNLSYEWIGYLEEVDFETEPVVLSTIHQFKGEEHKRIVLCCEVTPRVEEQFNDINLLDNEIRVWYVGITRAKEELYLVGQNDFIGS